MLTALRNLLRWLWPSPRRLAVVEVRVAERRALLRRLESETEFFRGTW